MIYGRSRIETAGMVKRYSEFLIEFVLKFLWEVRKSAIKDSKNSCHVVWGTLPTTNGVLSS